MFEVCLLVCQSYELEIRAALAEMEGGIAVKVRTFPSHCGSPKIFRDEWRTMLSNPKLSGQLLHVLGSYCLAGLEELVQEQGRTCRLHTYARCFDLLLDNQIIDDYLSQGAYLLTPGWLSCWRQHLEHWGAKSRDTRDF